MFLLNKNYNKNILIIQRYMTKYRIPLFEKMRGCLAESGIKLHVVNGTPTIKEAQKKEDGILPWSLRLPCYYWHIKNIRFVFQPIPEKLLAKQDLIIITQENSLLYNYWLLFRRKISGIRVAFWGHGANFQTEQPNSLRERCKRWISKQVDWWFAYTQLSAEKIIPSGFSKDRITILNNAIDTKELEYFCKNIPPSEIKSLRTKLGLKGKYVGVFIGSLYAEKRLDFLFTAADEIKRCLPDFELLIIGDGPLNKMVKDAVTIRSWIYWAGSRFGREKVLYASLGQIILNPGAVGLGILDSFIIGLPLITTECGIHGPEIAYLDSGHNGLITENNIQSFANGVLTLFCNNTLRSSMINEGKNDCKKYSLEQMVKKFCNGISNAIQVDKPISGK